MILEADTAETQAGLRDRLNVLLRQTFRPEFLNRLDEIIYFKGLTREQVSGIARLMIDELNARLAEKGVHVELTDAAMDKVISEAYSPEFGARPLRRYIQRTIETMLAKAIIKGDTDGKGEILIDDGGDGLYISSAAPRIEA